MTERSGPLDGEPGAEIERVVRQMKDQIALGRLKPRERLVEDDLCAQFGVSRHLIRSAFMRLGASRPDRSAAKQGGRCS